MQNADFGFPQSIYDGVGLDLDPAVAERPFMAFEPGYVLRSLDSLPKQGERAPWRLSMSYIIDVFRIRRERVDDGVLQFS